MIITSTDDALTSLGVVADSLTPDQRQQLDRDGFVPLTAVMSADLLQAFRARTDELLDLEGASAGHETPQGPGIAALADGDFHVWHGGTLNRTSRRRRGMTMSFCRRDEPQQLDQRQHVRKAVYDRISLAQRHLLDV